MGEKRERFGGWREVAGEHLISQKGKWDTALHCKYSVICDGCKQIAE